MWSRIQHQSTSRPQLPHLNDISGGKVNISTDSNLNDFETHKFVDFFYEFCPPMRTDDVLKNLFLCLHKMEQQMKTKTSLLENLSVSCV